MSDKLIIDLSCRDFVNDLSKKLPVPSGGSAAGLSGCLGVALSLMVANYTTGKKKYAEFEEDIQSIIIKAEKIKSKLLLSADKDAENFKPLSKAYCMKANTEDEKKEKEKYMQKCLKNAIIAPMEVIELSIECIQIHDELLKKGSKMLISDVGVGVQMLRSAILSAELNVIINLKDIKDEKFVEKINKKINKIDESIDECDKIYKEVKLCLEK